MILDLAFHSLEAALECRVGSKYDISALWMNAGISTDCGVGRRSSSDTNSERSEKFEVLYCGALHFENVGIVSL